MNYDFSSLDKKIEETKDWLENELGKIRTGRASASVLSDVTVESYGAQTPLDQLASIGNEGPRTLRVNVYDKSQIDAVEKAVLKEDLGVTVSKDDEGLRLSFPKLTEETREKALDRAKEKCEEARVSLRQKREEVWSDIQEKEADGEITEDEKFRLKDTLEEKVRDAKDDFDEMLENKQEELSV